MLGMTRTFKDARSELLVAMEPAIVALIKSFPTSREMWTFLEATYDRKGMRQNQTNQHSDECISHDG